MRKHRHHEISETGPGWAVFEFEGTEPLPGRWATAEDAHEFGNCGRYLLTGFAVKRVED